MNKFFKALQNTFIDYKHVIFLFKLHLPSVIIISLSLVSIFFLTTSIITGIIIFVNSKFDFSSIVNKNGFDNFYNAFKVSLSMLYAFIASTSILFTYKRIKQTDEQLSLMNIQRESSYRPELFLQNCHLIVFSKLNEEELIDTFKRKISFNISSGNKEGDSDLTLYNVGQASAINIKYRFTFDYHEAVNLITNTYPGFHIVNEDDIDIHYTIGKYFFSGFTTKYGFAHKTINFLLPEIKNARPEKIELPYFYIHLLIMYSSALIKKRLNLSKEFYKFPKLYVGLTYNDIGGQKHEKYFHVSIMYNSLMDFFDDDDNLRLNMISEFDIEFEEVNCKEIPNIRINAPNTIEIVNY